MFPHQPLKGTGLGCRVGSTLSSADLCGDCVRKATGQTEGVRDAGQAFSVVAAKGGTSANLFERLFLRRRQLGVLQQRTRARRGSSKGLETTDARQPSMDTELL